MEFLSAPGKVSIVDVRSEAEFAAGHIPNAINLPLFNNDERAEIGTLYKQQGRLPAILRGLEIVGPKMHEMAKRGLELAHEGHIRVHCWRGGMRSGSVAWLFERTGLSVTTLTGGYKAYRRLCLENFGRKHLLIVIGGKTGTRKTDILLELRGKGKKVIDLEALANHKGSAFGYTSDRRQPSQEQFENDLGFELAHAPMGHPVFIEDESRMIGRIKIPDPLWHQIRTARVLYLDWPLKDRVEHLLTVYDAPLGQIEIALDAIQKRLGLDRHRKAVEALNNGDKNLACEIILDYYDRAYSYGLSLRDQSLVTKISGENAVERIIAESDPI